MWHENNTMVRCRRAVVALIVFYCFCFVVSPLTPEKNFFAGVRDILLDIILWRYQEEKISTSYSVGFFFGEMLLFSFLILVTVYASCYFNGLKKRNGQEHVSH